MMCSTRGIKSVRDSDFIFPTRSMLVKVLLLTAISLALTRNRQDMIEDDLSLAQTRNRPDMMEDDQMQNVPWSWDPLYVPKLMLGGSTDEKQTKINEFSEILSKEILRYSEEMLRKDMENDIAREVVVQTRNGRNKWNRIQKRAEKKVSKDGRIRIV